MGLVPLLGTLMTGVVTPPEEIERLRKLGKGKKVSCDIGCGRTSVGMGNKSSEELEWRWIGSLR
jgi:hypothetical protein